MNDLTLTEGNARTKLHLRRDPLGRRRWHGHRHVRSDSVAVAATEGNQTFEVRLTSSTGAALADPSGLGRIADDG